MLTETQTNILNKLVNLLGEVDDPRQEGVLWLLQEEKFPFSEPSKVEWWATWRTHRQARSDELPNAIFDLLPESPDQVWQSYQSEKKAILSAAEAYLKSK